MKPRRARSDRAELTEGAIGPLLVRLTIPMVFGVLSMVLYNLVDAFFVGRLGREQLAALSFTFPVVLVIGSLSLGIGMGTAAVVSRAIGAGDRERVRRLATDSLVLGLLIVGAFVVLGLATIDPLFRLLGATDLTLPYIREYMRVWYPGMVFVVVPMIGNNSIRATGDTKTPGLIMMLGATVNAVLDPLLIFGLGPFPAFGIAGAAAATLIGRSITFTVALYVLAVRERLLLFSLPPLRDVLASWRAILYLGLPNAASRMIIPLGAGVVTRIVSGYGPSAVAGYGVATRIEFFALAIVNALSAVIGPFIGQNIGAKRIDRVKEGFRKAEWISFFVGAFFFVLFLLLADPIARLFNGNPEVYRVTARYLRIVSAAYGLQGLYVIVVVGLNVLRQPFEAVSLSFLEMFLLTVPLALLGSHFFGVTGVFTGILVSYSVTGLTARWMLRRRIARQVAGDSPARG